MSNTFGKIFQITSFGESHGSCVGIVVDGCPPGLPLNEQDIQIDVDRRKPASPAISTTRSEEDKVAILSGVFNGYTTGAPICAMVWNKDVDSSSYEQFRNFPRPGHADFTSYVKFRGFNDYRGSGRFSGRITAGFVMAGAIARKILDNFGIEVLAYTRQIGQIIIPEPTINEIKNNVWTNELRCPDTASSMRMIEAITEARRQGDSLGGCIEGIVSNMPVGLGQPVFDSLDGEIAKALFSIPAVKGVEFGAGFNAVNMFGSNNNDPFTIKNGKIETLTNNSGGILGGISNGMPLVVRVAIKPTPSIAKEQATVDIEQMKKSSIQIKGRHDACIVPRAVPVVAAMLAVTLCDFVLRSQMNTEVKKWQ